MRFLVFRLFVLASVICRFEGSLFENPDVVETGAEETAFDENSSNQKVRTETEIIDDIANDISSTILKVAFDGSGVTESSKSGDIVDEVASDLRPPMYISASIRALMSGEGNKKQPPARSNETPRQSAVRAIRYARTPAIGGIKYLVEFQDTPNRDWARHDVRTALTSSTDPNAFELIGIHFLEQEDSTDAERIIVLYPMSVTPLEPASRVAQFLSKVSIAKLVRGDEQKPDEITPRYISERLSILWANYL